MPGWCTYASHLENAPDVEIMCGGWNAKKPSAAGIWRQGHLLHFGFQPSPEDLNATGRAILTNSIHYIARFTEDRPIGETISVFSQRRRPEQRRYLESTMNRESVSSQAVADRFFHGELRKTIAGMEQVELAQWMCDNLAYLVPGEHGKFVRADDLAALEIDIASPSALDDLRSALDGEHADLAAGALARHVECGPEGADASEWKAYLESESPYLFFSEVAGYRFLLDPLAKKRGVPSKSLRGPARADR